MRRLIDGFAVVIAAVQLASCAQLERQPRLFAHQRMRQPGACEVAAGQGTSVSPNAARAIAEAGVRQETADVRGALLVSGLHHIRAEPGSVSCHPYVLGGGLTQCTATRRFCGR